MLPSHTIYYLMEQKSKLTKGFVRLNQTIYLKQTTFLFISLYTLEEESQRLLYRFNCMYQKSLLYPTTKEESYSHFNKIQM